MIFGPGGNDHAVDQHPRNLYLPRWQRAAFGDTLDLGDDDAPRIVRGHGYRLGLQGQGLPFHGHIAIRIGGRAADQTDMDREGLVEEIVLAVDAHQTDDVGRGAGIQLAAAVARIDEGAQADTGERAGLAGGDIAEQVGDNPLGQVIGLDLVADGQLLQARHETPVAADDAAN